MRATGYLIATYKQTYLAIDTEAGSYSSFPGHVGGARNWPENEATASFAGHVGGVRKWPENEATAMHELPVKVGVNLYVLERPTCTV